MKVLAITHAFPRTDTDPVGLFVLQLAQSLKIEGIQTTVIAPATAGAAEYEILSGVPVRRYSYAPRTWEEIAYTGTMGEQVAGSLRGRASFVGLISAGTRAALKETEKGDIDLIHAHWWIPGGMSGMIASAVRGIPMLITMHGTDVRMLSSRAGRFLFRWVAQNASGLTAVSSWMADTAASAGKREVVVAPMPVSESLFPPGGSNRQNKLLFVGKLTPQKGLAHLLHALALARTDAMLEVVGAGRVDDSELRALAEQLGLGRRIVWTPILPQHELALKYRESAALVVPATDEGLGLTVVEAAFSETPSIAFRSGGLVDVVRDRVTGILVPPADTTLLARAIDHLMSNHQLREQYGKAARTFALGRFGANHVSRSYANLYKGVIGR